MNHMWTPSLSATATIVSCSAIGLAFGRPEHLLSSSSQPGSDDSDVVPVAQKRKQYLSDTYEHENEHGNDAVMPSTSRLATSSPNTPLGISNIPLSSESDGLRNTSSSAERTSYDGRIWTGKVRRLASGDAAAQRRTDHERGSTSGSDGLSHSHELKPRPTTAVRSRNSWMKRLSSMSTTSNEHSISPSQPDSPTVAPSNVSMTVSNTESTIPMIVSAYDPPLSPNKLVKRISSRRLTGASSSGKIPTLRRPATSHQRSATIQNWSRAQDRNSPSLTPELPPRSRKPSPSDTKWKSFFSVKVNKKGTFSRSTDAPTEVKGVKRVLPDQSYYPTLITSKSIVTSTLDVDDFPEYDDDSVFFTSRPPSAFGFDPTPASKRLSHSAEETLNDQEPAPPRQQDEREPSPRRSFSFHDLLSRKPSRKGSLKTAANRLAKKAGKRVVSDPTVTSSKHQTDTSSTNFGRTANTEQNGFASYFANHSGANAARGTDPTLANPRFSFTSNTSHNEEYSPSLAQRGYFPSSPTQDQLPHSPLLPNIPARLSSHSGGLSDTSPSLAGSEADAHFMAHVDEDYGGQGKSLSYGRARGPRVTNGRRGSQSHFETIMDESPPKPLQSPLKDLLPSGMQMANDDIIMKSSGIIEEDQSMGSPVRTIRSDKADDGSPLASRALARSPLPRSVLIPSSPPTFAKPLNLGTLEYDDPAMDDDGESRWSCFDEDESEEYSGHDELVLEERTATPMALQRTNPFQIEVPLSAKSTATHESQLSFADMDLRKDTQRHLYDWSEQPTESTTGNKSPPRPKTVHGRKDADNRGSRPNKRHAPGGLHVRSQSVPVVPDLAGKRQTVITNKFGTWGVGSKGVTEDWDEDFDFDDKAAATASTSGGATDKRVDSTQPIAIPLKIQEYQANVMSNISLVREFGLMIEELKTLKPRATALGLVEQSRDDLYELVNSMIELADQEAEVSVARASPPSSPGIDMTDFEEQNAGQASRKQTRIASTTERHDTVMRTPPPSRPKRKTVLPLDNDVFTSPASQAEQSKQATPVPSNLVTRPRKDSEAMARSVIEALKKKKSTSDPSISLQPVPTNRRVQFDTRTLRHIVPYVSSLVRRVKEQIRDAEGLETASESDWDAEDEPHNPPIRQMFRDLSPSPGPESPSSRKAHILRTNNSKSNEGSPNLDEIDGKMRKMTVMENMNHSPDLDDTDDSEARRWTKST